MISWRMASAREGMRLAQRYSSIWVISRFGMGMIRRGCGSLGLAGMGGLGIPVNWADGGVLHQGQHAVKMTEMSTA